MVLWLMAYTWRCIRPLAALAAPPPAFLSAHRLFFYESQGFKHPHDGRSPFIDVTPVALTFLQTWGGFFNLG
jgi:hypothetical protein